MKNDNLKEKIEQLRPRYSEQYREMIEELSTKGDSSQRGDFARFGPFYQIYMYAFVIGARLGKMTPCKGKTHDFLAIRDWKPISVRNFTLLMLINRTKESWDIFNEDNEEQTTKFTNTLRKNMEEYANTGLAYIANLWEENRDLFSNPWVFFNILIELNTTTDTP